MPTLTTRSRNSTTPRILRRRVFHSLQYVRKFVALCPSYFGTDTEASNLTVRWATTIAFNRVDDGTETVECNTPTFTLCSHANTEITSYPQSIRILQ